MSATNYLIRSVWWNRRKVGDLGGQEGINQSLKRLVQYWREDGNNRIYIMSETDGTYSKPNATLIGAADLPGDEWDVSFFQTEDFLFVNASQPDNAKLFICMDDFSQLVRIPDVPYFDDLDLTTTLVTYSQEDIIHNNVKGLKADTNSPTSISFRLAWRLKNGQHVGHTSPIIKQLPQDTINGRQFHLLKFVPDTTSSFTQWEFNPSAIDKKIFDGITAFITLPKGNRKDVMNEGVYFEAVRWNMDDVLDAKTKTFDLTQEQLVTNPVMDIDLFTNHRFAGTVANNYNEILCLGGQFTDFANPQENRSIGKTQSTINTNCWDEVTIEVGGQTFTRFVNNNYYEDAEGELIIPQTFTYPDRRAIRWRVWHFLGTGNGYELVADIKLKPHPKLNIAYNFVGGGAFSFTQNKASDQAIPSSGSANVHWSSAPDTKVEVPAADTYQVEVSIVITTSGSLFGDTLALYKDDGSTETLIANISTNLNAADTYTFSDSIVMGAGDSFVVKYTNSGGSSGTITSASFLKYTRNTLETLTFNPNASANYLVTDDEEVNYETSGATETMTDAEGTSKVALNEINLIEKQKVKISDITKFYFPDTYELGDDNFSNECLALLVNTNDISQGQFGQYPLYAFTKNKIYAFEFNTSNEPLFRRVVTVFSEFGIQNRDAIIPYNGSFIFISPRGIHQLSGNKVEDLHIPIQEHWNFPLLVGTPSAPVTDSKVFFNHKLQEVYFYNDSFTETFLYSIRYNMWCTFDHLIDAQHLIYDEEFPYIVTKTGLYNLENLSDAKVTVNVRTKPYKITDKRDLKKLWRSFIRGRINKDDADLVHVKLQGVVGVNSMTDLVSYAIQSTGTEVYYDLPIRFKYGSQNYFKFLLNGDVQALTQLVSLDLDVEIRSSKLLNTHILPDKPETPTGLAAVPGSAGNDIDLTWTDASDNETGFEIWRSTNASTGFARIKTVAAGTQDYTDNNNGIGLSYSTTYYYKVAAINLVELSPFSNVANATTLAPPLAPTNLVATANGVGTIDLTWTDVATTEDGYTLERSTDNATWTIVSAAIAADAESYTDTGLADNTLYYYRLKATNDVGDSDYVSASVTTWAPWNIAADNLSNDNAYLPQV